MTEKKAGSCLCGAVQFEVTGEFESFFLCHCTRCRKDTGSAHAANLFSTKASLDWIAGQDRVRTYRVPETRHEKSFCSRCGSAVPGLHMEGALLVVPAGSVDGEINIEPTAHICFADRADWYTRLENTPRVDRLPG